jgi:3-hydroxyacyl-[acyl-carrier-protein] dehydratase
MNEPIALDINGVMKYLPHRYPFLLVDRVLEFVPGKSIRALKNVTYNEPYFTGHFPQRPLMPGVIIIEALAQTAGLLAFLTADVIPDDNTRFYFVGIDKARFRKPVEPGDQLILIVNLERNFKGIYRLACRAEVAGEEVANALIMIAPDLRTTPGAQTPAELP